MKVILVILLGIAVGWFVLTHYIQKPAGFKPFLPTVFFEPPEDQKAVLIDFSSCAAGKGVSSGAFGSVNIEMWSYDISLCNFEYSYDSGKTVAKCLVPKSTKSLKFKKASDGVDFSPIYSYCK